MNKEEPRKGSVFLRHREGTCQSWAAPLQSDLAIQRPGPVKIVRLTWERGFPIALLLARIQ